MKRTLIVLMVVAALLAFPFQGASAATSANVTVTATPAYISITNSPSTWTINGISGSGKLNISTTYYSSNVSDTTSPSATVSANETYFTIDNTSNIATNITVNFPDFTGGDAMTNSNTGSATGTSFGAYAYHEGMTFTSKVVAQASGSSALKSNLAASTDLNWGVQISTRTNAWTSGSAMSSTVTVTATAA